MRIGIGFDIHRFEKGRELILAGIKIPFEFGLIGHSDGDVVFHAISDAISGALAIEDIGTRFPDSDPGLKGISSQVILESYYESLVKAKGKILNLDIVIIAEEPKLKQWYGLMKKNISDLLKISSDQVGIKAKTFEGLGDIGKGKAIACLTSILIDC